jgi:protein-tyrosine sulfotransferase
MNKFKILKINYSFIIFISILLLLNVIYSKINFRSEFKSELIFIGGRPRSGTTLMRAILDTDETINCGVETKILPRFVRFILNWLPNLKYVDMKKDDIDEAVRMFILNVINGRNNFTNKISKNNRQCVKDPPIIEVMSYLYYLFPNAKFIFMVRDGRDVSYSHIKRAKENLNLNNFKKYLIYWMKMNEKGLEDCNKIGINNCLLVRYEDLVLQPEKTIRKIVVNFLKLKWSNKFLKHQEFIGSEIKVKKDEWSSHQIVKPINSESINSWINKIENFDPNEIKFIEPTLNKFNYSFIINYAINYTQIESLVVKNNQNLKENKDYWMQKSKNYSYLF